jgi:DNA-binding NarL/FixJ family response regulator
MIPINIWVVEDDTVYRRSLQRLLNSEEHITCSRVFSSCITLLEAIETEPHPDLVLMDLGLPDMGGVEGIQRLAVLAPDLAVVVLTVFADKEKVLESLDAGAAGYLLKSATPEEIVHGLQDVFLGGAALSPAVAKTVLQEMRKPKASEQIKLSPREMEALKLLAAGHPVKQVADELGISFDTARFHIKNLYTKLHVQSQSGAITKAYKAGLL